MYPGALKRALAAALHAHEQAAREPSLRNLSMANFVLSIVKAEPRMPQEPISPEDAELLASGEHRDGDRVIRFRVPPDRGFTADLPSMVGSGDMIDPAAQIESERTQLPAEPA